MYTYLSHHISTFKCLYWDIHFIYATKYIRKYLCSVFLFLSFFFVATLLPSRRNCCAVTLERGRFIGKRQGFPVRLFWIYLNLGSGYWQVLKLSVICNSTSYYVMFWLRILAEVTLYFTVFVSLYTGRLWVLRYRCVTLTCCVPPAALCRFSLCLCCYFIKR